MSEQTHIIKRQVIELTVQDAAAARRFQHAASLIYRQQIVPLVDQYCTELSAPDQLHRIERLELDVGVINAQNFEAELVAKVSATLRQALAAQIKAPERSIDRTQAQLELFVLFARTGSLPWWADAATPRPLENALELLLRHAPAPLAKLMRELAHQQGPLQRIIDHIPDALLAALVGILTPAIPPSRTHELQAMIELLQATGAAVGHAPFQLRRSAWSALLRVTSLAGQHYPDAGALYQAALQRIAAERGTAYGELLDALQQNAQAKPHARYSAMKRIVDSLDAQRPGTILATHAMLAQRLAQLQREDGPHADVWTLLRTFAPQLTAALQNELLAALREMEGGDQMTPRLAQRLLHLFQSAPIREHLSSVELSNLTRVLDTVASTTLMPVNLRLSEADELHTHLTQLQSIDRQHAGIWALLRTFAPQLAAPLQNELLAVLHEHAGDEMTSHFAQRLLHLFKSTPIREGLSPAELSKLTHTLDAVAKTRPEPLASPEPTVDLHFSDADELYIGNAGLIILWPFLSNFFARVGLLEGQRFNDSAAQQRAAGLLQHIATGDLIFPEYLLPLNKVLCGLELTAVFDFGPPLLDFEVQECADLLRAAIAQAPILRDMSPEGFRGTFLLRPAVLSSHYGTWLLRVERQTYDLVLDHFPWGWEWVRLPWMDAMLRVEW